MNELLDDALHTMPTFGPQHYCTPNCWCHPQLINWAEIERGEDWSYIYVHNVVH